jgi:hypothetical protein
MRNLDQSPKSRLCHMIQIPEPMAIALTPPPGNEFSFPDQLLRGRGRTGDISPDSPSRVRGDSFRLQCMIENDLEEVRGKVAAAEKE